MQKTVRRVGQMFFSKVQVIGSLCTQNKYTLRLLSMLYAKDACKTKQMHGTQREFHSMAHILRSSSMGVVKVLCGDKDPHSSSSFRRTLFMNLSVMFLLFQPQVFIKSVLNVSSSSNVSKKGFKAMQCSNPLPHVPTQLDFFF